MPTSSEILDVYIVDDEPRAIETLSKVLVNFIDHINVVGTATNISDAYAGITKHQPRLVFIDVEMGAETGFELLEKFDEVTFQVAFVTAHEEFALKAIKFSAVDYIIKPAGISELKTLIQKVRQLPVLGSENKKVKQLFGNLVNTDINTHKITLPVAEGYEFVRVMDIYYVRADGSYSVFKLTNGHQLISSKNLKFYTQILEDYQFYRIHNSTLVNLRYINKLNKALGGSVVMEDGTEFSISKSRKEDFLKILAIK